jgi:chemotaxis methyl-accepting protein methylase
LDPAGSSSGRIFPRQPWPPQLRARAASLGNVEFRKGDPAAMIFDQPFDVVVGRYVLQFMTEPAATLARLASHLRPGGVIFFHELDWSGARSTPIVPTYDLACPLGGGDHSAQSCRG